MSINKKLLVLAERTRKKSAPGKFYKQSVENISYFNKEKIIFNRKKQKTDKISYIYSGLYVPHNIFSLFYKREELRKYFSMITHAICLFSMIAHAICLFFLITHAICLFSVIAHVNCLFFHDNTSYLSFFRDITCYLSFFRDSTY